MATLSTQQFATLSALPLAALSTDAGDSVGPAVDGYVGAVVTTKSSKQLATLSALQLATPLGNAVATLPPEAGGCVGAEVDGSVGAAADVPHTAFRSPSVPSCHGGRERDFERLGTR